MEATTTMVMNVGTPTTSTTSTTEGTTTTSIRNLPNLTGNDTPEGLTLEGLTPELRDTDIEKVHEFVKQLVKNYGFSVGKFLSVLCKSQKN